MGAGAWGPVGGEVHPKWEGGGVRVGAHVETKRGGLFAFVRHVGRSYGLENKLWAGSAGKGNFKCMRFI